MRARCGVGEAAHSRDSAVRLNSPPMRHADYCDRVSPRLANASARCFFFWLAVDSRVNAAPVMAPSKVTFLAAAVVRLIRVAACLLACLLGWHRHNLRRWLGCERHGRIRGSAAGAARRQNRSLPRMRKCRITVYFAGESQPASRSASAKPVGAAVCCRLPPAIVAPRIPPRIPHLASPLSACKLSARLGTLRNLTPLSHQSQQPCPSTSRPGRSRSVVSLPQPRRLGSAVHVSALLAWDRPSGFRKRFSSQAWLRLGCICFDTGRDLATSSAAPPSTIISIVLDHPGGSHYAHPHHCPTFASSFANIICRPLLRQYTTRGAFLASSTGFAVVFICNGPAFWSSESLARHTRLLSRAAGQAQTSASPSPCNQKPTHRCSILEAPPTPLSPSLPAAACPSTARERPAARPRYIISEAAFFIAASQPLYMPAS
ncbi:hypothetical protein L1887_55331 [Cichorium endivia]|nr:hypothetical protein L1887_55331 [Cichorium endivia]